MIARRPPRIRTGLDAALDSVHARVKRALVATHAQLAELGVPHALIGGLAVGTHGYQYATDDVDWLVSKSAAFDGKIVLMFKPGIPIQVGEVRIDYLTPDGPPNVVRAMKAALTESRTNPENVTVVSAELLVWMKLKAGRSKDTTAVVELLRAGQIDGDAVRGFLVATGDERVLRRFDDAALKALVED